MPADAEPEREDPVGSSALPSAVVDAVRGQPIIGAAESAALFITVRADGFPHVTLLSRAELATSGDRLLVALAGTTTPGNLDRTGHATLLIVVDDTAHSCDVAVHTREASSGRVGYAMDLVSHRADSLGIPLTPITYTTPPELPSVERWDASSRLLEALAPRG